MEKSTVILFPINATTNSTMAWTRICFWIGKNIPNVYVVNNQKTYNVIADREDFDNIIVPYGSAFLCRNYNNFIYKNKKAKRFWLCNEYSLILDGKNCFGASYRDLGYEVIANMPQDSYKIEKEKKYQTKWHMLPLNVTASRLYIKQPKVNDLLYWGRYREDREHYFQKYFCNEKWFISTSVKRENIRNFLNYNKNLNFIKKIDFQSYNNAIAQTKATIYIEDKWTHNNYNSLSDRFYEAISLRCIPFFDEDTKNTIKNSNYNIPDEMIVKNTEEILDRLDKNICDFRYFDTKIKEEKETLKNMLCDLLL